MAYIGPAPNPGQNREVDDISSGFNGSEVNFTLQVNSQNVSPGSANAIIVSLGGVVQNPGTDYTIAASTITFTTAPASGLSFFGLVLGQSIDTEGTADGSIINASVSGSAAIAGTKISPNFGSQNIVTTGSISGAAGTFTSDLDISEDIRHIGDTDTKLKFPAADTISLQTAGSERLRVDSSGRLLIGHTTSLAAANAEFSFQILGTSFATTSVTQQRYAADVSGPSIIFGKSRGSLGVHTIVNDGDELGKIRFYGSDGNDFNNYGAEIKVNVDGTPGSNDMPGRLVFSTTDDGGNTPAERMRIDSSGRVMINTTNNALGGVTGNLNIANTNTNNHTVINCSRNTTNDRNQIRFLNPNGNVGSITSSGTSSSFNTASDYRLKENEVAISDGITRLKQLKPYKFNFKTDSSTILDGFFAHEVSSIVPEAITGTKDAIVTQAMIDAGEFVEGTLNDPIHQGIDQSKLVPLLTAALQEAITKIETLETKVAALEAA